MKPNNLRLFLIKEWYSQNKTILDLANKLNVDQTLISKWLNDAIEPPLDRKIQLAKELGVDSRILFPVEGE